MKVTEEKELIEKLIDRLRLHARRPVKIMEVCGTHTVAIFKHGIKEILPENITMLSGPGCPVCVTTQKDIDWAINLARQEGVILTLFGDMMRVPGSSTSLYREKAEGRDVRVVYSPLDALRIARDNPAKEVVFFATGFETTSPSIAATIKMAEGVKNFSVYSTLKLVPPVLKALLETPELMIDGFILPGHVSTIIGARAYAFIAGTYLIPSVIAGFDAFDILSSLYLLLIMINGGTPRVEIEYREVVHEEGNTKALALLEEVFEPVDANWRGLGMIPKSGLGLRDSYNFYDAKRRFPIEVPELEDPKGCRCGDVLKGLKLPPECPHFGKTCTPEHPVGACMVSTEGSCAVYYHYGRL